MADKPTVIEIEQRVEDVVDLLAQGLRKGKIKKILFEKYEVKARTVERYLARARARILARRDTSRNEIQADSLAFYELIASGEVDGATIRDRLFARKRLDELLGLDEPRRVELSGKIDTDSEFRQMMARAAGDPKAAKLAAALAESMAKLDTSEARLKLDSDKD